MDKIVDMVLQRVGAQRCDAAGVHHRPSAKLLWRAPAAAEPCATATTLVPVDCATLRQLTGEREPPTVNKSFLSRTVASLQTQNRIATEAQMWSEREADNKYEALRGVARRDGSLPRHAGHKRPRVADHAASGGCDVAAACEIAGSAASERAYWAELKAAARVAAGPITSGVTDLSFLGTGVGPTGVSVAQRGPAATAAATAQEDAAFARENSSSRRRRTRSRGDDARSSSSSSGGGSVNRDAHRRPRLHAGSGGAERRHREYRNGGDGRHHRSHRNGSNKRHHHNRRHSRSRGSPSPPSSRSPSPPPRPPPVAASR